ncbi:MAG: DUF6316 family protein [Gammaproteobacteria bacterium]
MSDTRQHDRPGQTPPERSDRVFTEQDLWYFRTREGHAVGPFRYRSEAESNLDRFMSDLRDRLEALTDK